MKNNNNNIKIIKKHNIELVAYWDVSGLKFKSPKSRISKSCKITIGFIVATAYTLLILQESQNIYNMINETRSLKCFYERNHYGNILNNNSVLPSKSIFFVKPLCSEDFTMRQACAIESAAILHPTWQINVIYGGIMFNTNILHRILRSYDNIKFWTVNIKDFVAGTPLDDLLKVKLFKSYCANVQGMAEVIKHLTLYRWPGIFVDMEVIVARPFDSMPKNWMVREDENNIGRAIMALSGDAVGRDIARRAVSHIQEHRIGWCSIQDTMTAVLLQYCKTSVDNMSSNMCNGFHVIDSQFVYPLPKSKASLYFKDLDIPTYEALTYYLWGEGSIQPSEHTPYELLAKQYCRSSYLVSIAEEKKEEINQL